MHNDPGFIPDAHISAVREIYTQSGAVQLVEISAVMKMFSNLHFPMQ